MVVGGILFTLFVELSPIGWTKISQSVVAIGRSLTFPMEISPQRVKEENLYVQKSMYNFEAASQLMFRHNDIFNILLWYSSLRHS